MVCSYDFLVMPLKFRIIQRLPGHMAMPDTFNVPFRSALDFIR